MEKRTCRICNENKRLSEFERDNRCEGIYTNRCKSCKLRSADRANNAFYKLRQRAEMNGNKVEVTLDEVKSLFTAFDGECIYCGAKEDPDGPTYHLEHLIPQSQGGRNHISNLVISCKTCNLKKNNKPVVKYFLDEESFKPENFNVLIQYIALSSGQPVKALLDSLVNDTLLFQLRKKREALSK